jgi:hypothetical protein
MYHTPYVPFKFPRGRLPETSARSRLPSTQSTSRVIIIIIGGKANGHRTGVHVCAAQSIKSTYRSCSRCRRASSV